MGGYKEDFHIHTNYSDGQAAPKDIVERAAELGYETIAITDHDGVDGINEAVNAGENLKIKVVPGVELATETEEGIGLHILGHYIDIENKNLRRALTELARNRDARNARMIAALNDMGYDLSQEDLKKLQPNNFIGKPVIARALAANGYIDDYRDAFKEGQFFGCSQLKKIKKKKLKAADAVNLITGAGGRAVLAHPIQTRGIGEKNSQEFYDNIELIIKRLKDAGLGGIECYHPDQDSGQSERFKLLAEKYDLEITRGSDFHGRDFAEADVTAEPAVD